MPFRYKLQNVLALMEKREKTIDAEVMAANRHRNEEQDRLNEIETRKAAAQKGLAGQMATGASNVAASNDYIQLLGIKAETQAKAVKAAEAELEKAQKRQQEARRERQKLEKHKEMMFQQWVLDEKKRDAKKMDDMAGTIFMKKRNLLEEERLEELDRLEKLEKLQLLRALREKQQNKF